MEQSQFPKILIFGPYMHTTSGGGITLANLLKGWPLNKIAIATYKIFPSGLDYCLSYYQLGYEENKRPWPFHLIQKKQESGPVYYDHKKISNIGPDKIVSPAPQNHSFIKNFILNLRHFLGIYPLIYRLNVSKKFLAWVEEYNPDIIYTQLEKIQYMIFLSQLLEMKKIPLAIHIMDDWPKTLKEPGLFYYFWKRYINRLFSELLNYSGILMSICQAMSDEYFNRYGKEFIPFHNTVDLLIWDLVSKKDWTIHGTFTILYAGRIGRGTSNSLLTIAKAIEVLGAEGLNIMLKIQTRVLPESFRDEIKNNSYVMQEEFVPYEELPEKLSNVDLLVLPMDFDKYNLDFIHLSMPTKVPEYLASGTPILVFASESTALYKYASDLKWGYTISDNNIGSVASAIRRLYQDIDLRKTLGLTGKEVARKNHDGIKVRDDFRKVLSATSL